MSVSAIHGDVLDVISRLVSEGVEVDACVCDPPYHLTATQKRFGAANSAPAQYGRDGAMARLSSGFMSQQWDGGDIAFRPETWATVSTIMRPGAFLVAFGGTRTYHRLACAIEDAGFVVQDCLMWLFATGFPKNKAQLKPAYEPIVLAYKPGGKRMMQIGECRVGIETTTTIRSGGSGAHGIYGRDDRVFERENPHGRWPANLCHDGSDEVVGMFPHTKASPQGLITQGGDHFSIGSDKKTLGTKFQGHGDSGSAARFFFCAKAGAEDRWGSRHPTVKPVELMKWLVKLVTPPNGTVLDCFAGSGTTGVAALGTGRNAILIEREEQYYNDIRERLAFYEGGGLHSSQAKGRNRKVEHGPLFAKVAAE